MYIMFMYDRNADNLIQDSWCIEKCFSIVTDYSPWNGSPVNGVWPNYALEFIEPQPCYTCSFILFAKWLMGDLDYTDLSSSMY